MLDFEAATTLIFDDYNDEELVAAILDAPVMPDDGDELDAFFADDDRDMGDTFVA